MKILHVVPDWPYPPHHGGRIDVYERICALAALGHDVDVVATVKQPPETVDVRPLSGIARSVQLVPRFPNWRSLHPSRPLQMYSRRMLRNLTPEDSYDLALLEQEYTCEALPAVRSRARRTVVRIHNNESAYFAALAASERSWDGQAVLHQREPAFPQHMPGVVLRSRRVVVYLFR